ncbi:MAG: hypothetical protein KU37_08865 [Sulfuricurvum sp. PC08-66]|nr:MAG: hypothetical protein KU37_08865 [Sulfuricurvum sp. PC08-66]
MKPSQALSTLLSVDTYNNSYYTTHTHLLQAVERPKYQKNSYVIGYLQTKAYLTTTIKLNRSIQDEDITDVIENKTYEELNLDVASEYLIEYYEMKHLIDDKSRSFMVFVVDPEVVRSHFQPTVERLRYIDYITPVALLFKSLYSKEILRQNSVDLFLYATPTEAFFTLYKEGEFLYTKELSFSYAQMHEQFCALYGEQVPYENFMTLLIDEGLRTTNEHNRRHFFKLLNEMLNQVREVINFVKRAYDLESIDKIYIGTSQGVIIGLDEYTKTYLGIETFALDFEYGFQTTQFYVDQLHQLMHLAAHAGSTERYDVNFTLFNRPPAFAKRQSGKLLLIAAASLLLSIAYPLYNIGFAKYAQIENDSLVKESQSIHQTRTNRQALIDQQLAQRSALQAKQDEALRIQTAQKNVLTKIHEQKINYAMKSVHLVALTQALNAHGVWLEKFSYAKSSNTKEHVFQLQLLAPKERNITQLIHALTTQDPQRYLISTDAIRYESTKGLYTSFLKVVLQ